MNRREFIMTSAAAAAAAGTPASANEPELKAIAREAYLYSLPLTEMETVRARLIGNGGAQNTIYARRVLADHTSRGVTSPNNDTLYASAWLDLSQGPVTITLPDFGKRYFSLQLMDMFTNSFAVLGTRVNGGKAGTFQLVSPANAPSAASPNIIRAPTPRVWALGRTLVDGPQDLEAANKAQAGVTIAGPKVAGTPNAASAKGRTAGSSWRDYFAEANRLLREHRGLDADTPMLARIAPLGIGPDDLFSADRFSAEQQTAIEAGVAEARAFVIDPQRRGNEVDGWYYPGPTLGDFGTDYVSRAVVARTGLAALPRQEAMYMRPAGEAGNALYDGRKAWRFRFAAGKLPPVDAFWSLTMYERTADGQSFFTQNAINRYAIGDRTPGLQKNDDGSLDIWIGNANPGASRETNWLPAPAGPFTMTLRAYLPKPDVLNGSYRLPRVTEAG
jgi:hypothetical protein